ncbi:MAG TPA: VWA domain-containing protein [Candidatus Angelobacter sp.]|nr:VWA domain-containing protein [Candidatus Angelobacter sp.]
MNRFRYGAYDDGPDPLAPPYDAGRAVDEIGDRVLDGSGVRDALRDLMQRGADGVRGLDDLMRRVQQRRRSLERTGRMDGTLDRARELLDRAVDAERQALFPDPSDDARFREAQLDALPSRTAPAVRELADYDWRSPEARAAYDELRDMLRREVLDQQFRGMKQALQDPAGSESRQALKDMMGDLNRLLEKHQRGEDTTQDFADFMAKHGDFFPERPGSVEELLDQLARQAAAMARMLESMTPEQRQELSELMAQALGDLDLASEMGRLGDNLRAMRPDLPWSGRQRLRGDEPLGLGDATEALADLADLDALADALAQDYPGSSIEDVDEEAVARALGRQAVDDLRRLQEIERELERQGYLTRAGGQVELTAKAIRRIGQTALRRVFASLETGGRGDHDVHDAGAAGELTGTTREWRFGDEQPLDVVRTVSNSVRRRMVDPASPLLRPEDFEIRETERRTRAAVVLLVDQSFSMVMNDTWRTAKTTAMALHALATTQFPLDAVEIIAFANLARRIAPHELPDLDANEVQGTNLQHALMLAGRFLDRHPDAEPVVLIVTDGEPTAHLDRDGEWWFSWPPGADTIALTLAEVDKMTRRGVPLSFFRLGDDPRLARFLDDVARRNGGRVLAPQGDRLGDYVVSDYLRQRRGRRRSA